MESTDSRILRPEFRLGIIFAAWTLFGVAQIVLSSVLMQHWNDVYLTRSFVMFMPRVWAWALVTPLITRWDFAVQKRFPTLAGRIAGHAPLYIACGM